ncbi:MAG: PAS domain-containing protein [Kouleothrix sp.]|nr:PAS domain-containing protein [Kouleothrix sp.]
MVQWALPRYEPARQPERARGVACSGAQGAAMTLPNDTPQAPTPAEPPLEQRSAEPRPPSFIVGIGASAGGLEAFTTFFTHMPPNSGMAFVLVQHLDPQQPSLLPELLATHTPMPVRAIEDRMPVAPNHVYLIPPNAALAIEGAVLRLEPPSEPHGRRLPIDHFFTTLAADQGARAIGIVLSGTGTDGTLGLVAIKEHGGLTIAQAPESAGYDGMPRSAIARGAVDRTLPIAQMPAALLARAQPGTDRPSVAAGGAALAATPEDLRAISAILRDATGHDFSHYKPATLQRRIARRMQLVGVERFDAYVERLRQDRREIDLLFQDLLISVTHFFRDPAAFEALARAVIPEIFRSKGPAAPVRVWVPGCATGEEAYTIAMLLCEHMARLATPPPVQVFATDIDDQALDVARQGRYEAKAAAHVSAERLAAFFAQDERGYQVTKAIRELCIFSTHNLISDPPFARMDLIACRNLLIYLDVDLQRKLVPLLHYALAPQGYLFLGASESVAAHPELFRTVDKQQRLFQRKDLLVRSAVAFPLSEPSRRPIRRYGAAHRLPATSEQQIGDLLERILLAQYAPPAVIINEQSEIVFFSDRTGAYLEPPAGAPSLNILVLIHPQLRLALQTAIRASLKDHAPSVRENLAITTADAVQRLNLIVRPLAELGPDSGLLLVVFQELGPLMSAAQAQAAGLRLQSDEPIAQQLTYEIQTMRATLETTIDELQEANAELTLANEELLSLNEELQSANEELQTSKEEIQSINEELQTVNAELNRKVEELDRVNADLANLFASIQIPAIFLHADGRIARFTPAATEVFRLIEGDVGRPITDIAPRFRDGDLAALVGGVLRTLVPYEEPVRRPASDIWWIMRIQPYRTLANVIDGVVMTFSDITNLKQAAAERERLLAAVEQARNDAEQIVETVRAPLIILDANLRVQSANHAFYRMFQVTPAETQQTVLYALGDRQWDTPELRALLGERLDPNTAFEDVEITQTFPQIGTRTVLLNARQLEYTPASSSGAGARDAPLLLLALEDITERAQAAAALQRAHDALEERVQSRTSELARANTALQTEISERERAEQARQLLLRQLVTAQEEERRRIARELHDQMGQDLTVLLLGLKALRDAAPLSSPIHSHVEPLQALSMRIGREVRTLALQLRPPALDDLGLVATLTSYVDEWSARVLIAVDFHARGLEQQRLPLAIETALYRLVQEALTNVLKHAQAANVSLIIERRADAVQMIVEDDGVGFDVEATRRTAHTEQRLGLVGMDERVAQLGGTLTIESAPGRGTTVFVHIPLVDKI